MNRVVDLPSRGRLLVGTDLQGNYADFCRLASLFEAARKKPGDATLVLTGDLVHGPELARSEWPEALGTFYAARSVDVIAGAMELAERHPGRVFYLLGNHEHAHLGGPVVSKFFPDEAARLDELLGAARARAFRAWLKTWPLVAVAERARIALLHGAPHAAIESRRQVETLPLDADFEETNDRAAGTILAAILWARGTSAKRARSFLRALEPHLAVAIHGHDVVREGFASTDPQQLCVSTSFGCFDGDKVYVDWDLSEPATKAADVVARGLKRLWPASPPIYLDARVR